MITKFRVEATGDNGYECSCCRNSWDIEEEYDTLEALIEDCSNNYNSNMDGFNIGSIYIIEYSTGCEIKRIHPDEGELIAKIGTLADTKKVDWKEQQAITKKNAQQEIYRTELAGMEARKAFLEAQLRNSND